MSYVCLQVGSVRTRTKAGTCAKSVISYFDLELTGQSGNACQMGL